MQNQIQTLQQELFKLKGSVVEGIQQELTEFKRDVAGGLNSLAQVSDTITGSNVGEAFADLISESAATP